MTIKVITQKQKEVIIRKPSTFQMGAFVYKSSALIMRKFLLFAILLLASG